MRTFIRGVPRACLLSTPPQPLAIDLFAGLGGWTDGLMAEGWFVIGFDIEQHVYGEHRYPGHLILQDVLTLHGSQFKDAALIVASPPCQAYSYRAMPWKRAKALPPPDNTLFEACFRIQREACEAAGRHIPLIVENVRGAQKWVGRSRWNFGSFHLWGDVPALMPQTLRIPPKRAMDDLKNGQRHAGNAHLPIGSGPDGRNAPGEGFKVAGFRFDGSGRSFQSASVAESGVKRGQDFTRIAGKQAEGFKGVPHRTAGHWTNPAEHEGVKINGDSLFSNDKRAPRMHGSKSNSRKAASAMIAKIPLPLSRWIGRVMYPVG